MSASAPKKVLIAGLFHETNTFLDGRTRIEDFQMLCGAQILNAAGDSSPLAGAVEAAERFGWSTIPAIDMRAMPGPVVEDAVIERFWGAFSNVVYDAAPIDGVLLILHGAMVSESSEDVEGSLLARMRELPGLDAIPICGVLDLHANVTEAMAKHADALVAYRENPHTDAKQTATRAAAILDRLMTTGARPVTVWRHGRILWPATGTGTAQEPMLSLERMARQMERSSSEILAVNVFAGFAYADVPDAGVSFTAITLGEAATTEGGLAKLVEHAQQNRALGDARNLSLDETIERVKQHESGPVLLVEPADNIGAGTSGRGIAILKALLEHSIDNAVVVVQAPEVVTQLSSRRVGERVTIALGSTYDPEPLKIDVELISSSDGRFTLEDPQSHLASLCGGSIDMGPCAVVRKGGVRILLTSRKTPPFDLGQLRSQGIVPEDLFVIGVKAAVAHKRAYDPIAKASYTVDTPGACTSNLRSLPYQRVRRPIHPLD